MEEDASTHPDEGTIHAWLDGALDSAPAARIAEHVRGCAQCSARVAEARGLIAGASRIVTALDDVPAGTRPVWSQDGVVSGDAAVSPAATAARASDASVWRWLRVTPARAAIAATLIVAAGITLTRQRTAVEVPRVATTTSSPAAPSPDAPAPASAEAARTSDHVLDSAVARSLALSHPPRALNAAPGVAIPQVPAGAASGSVAPDSSAGVRVAEGRRAVAAQRDAGAAERADRAQVRGFTTTPPVAAKEAVVAARAADEAASTQSGKTVAVLAPSSYSSGAKTCYLLESRTPSSTWGGVPLPLVVALDSAARAGSGPAAVLTRAGAPTAVQARWTRAADDSVTLSLRRIGFSGAIALGPELGGGRAGLARSAPSSLMLESVVVTSVGAESRQDAAGDARSRRKVAAPALADGGRPSEAPAAAPAAPKANPRAGQAPEQSSAAARDLPVTMRPTACPVR
jgi:uncharacterized MAPEG superfamily protein